MSDVAKLMNFGQDCGFAGNVQISNSRQKDGTGSRIYCTVRVTEAVRVNEPEVPVIVRV